MLRRVQTEKIFLAWLRFRYLCAMWAIRKTAWLGLIEPDQGRTAFRSGDFGASEVSVTRALTRFQSDKSPAWWLQDQMVCHLPVPS
jgi:hypothetical protein